MQQYQKKTASVEAAQVLECECEPIKLWLGACYAAYSISVNADESRQFQIAFNSPSGLQVVKEGEWIVKEGDVYTAMSSDVFNANYEAV